jgi:ubiquinone/menaquinone biosynthesis C-methylase UbiE
MLATRVSDDEIDQMNLAAGARITKRWQEEESEMIIPEEDLKLFFKASPGKVMLDVGCGWGRYVDRFTNQGMKYLGVDHQPEALKVASDRNPNERFKLISFHDLELEFGTEVFDALWCCCIFGGEPKRQMPAALEQMRSVLRVDGIAIFVLPSSFESDEHTTDTSVGKMYFAEWRFDEFKQAVQDAGFHITYAIQRFADGSMTVVAKKV